jgi:Tfp pilus assembly protein PilO
MDKTKQTLVIAVVAVLVVVAGGWYFLISPQRSSVASLNEQTTTVNGANATLKGKIDQLKAQAADLPAQQLALAAIAKRLPPDAQYATLISNLSNAADAANVDLSIITPAAPVLAASSVVAPPAPVASAAAGKSAAPKAVTPRTAPANQLYQIPLALTVSGNYFDLEMFIHSLEGMQRAMLINQLTFAKLPPSGATVGSTTTDGAAAGTTTSPAGGTSQSTTSGNGKTVAGSKPGKTGKTTTAKTVPGSVAGAQAELNRLNPLVPDTDTITLQIAGQVFSMYSPAGAAAAAQAAAIASASPAPTK